MKIPFTKYQGTGNDFVIIDNRVEKYLTRKDSDQIKDICDRKFGVGADGLILLQNKQGYDFEMVYFNSDGQESSMCGNGGRCIAAFAKQIGVIENQCYFLAIDGPHEAKVIENGWVELKMGDVPEIEVGSDYFVLNTGSPHYVVFVEDLDDIDVVETGQLIRYSDRFRKEGINVNFVEKGKNQLLIGTYERGVEDETLSCGTGVTAAALSFAKDSHITDNEVFVKAKGGDLSVRFQQNSAEGFENIWLCGKATKVFKGII